MDIRVGFGFDVHPLAEGREFWLGGVQLSHDKGPLGHSDADALIHALCDALLGAAGLRDIGFHFPDTSEEFRGIDSKILLARVTALLHSQGWRVVNADCTVCLERPKIKPAVDEMVRVMSGLMEVSPQCVSVKATTNEKMGFVGREEGITAYAVALIRRD